jgi:dihydroflavonol-4-reductase
MAKILVTGGNGFLGSWTVRKLIDLNHEVYCLLRPQSDISELKNLNYHRVNGDVTHAESLLKACQGMDGVFHLAGLVAYKASERKKMENVNVQGTKNVIEACLKNKVPRLLHVSSVVAVGASYDKASILDENSEYNISSLNLGYFQTKHDAELAVLEAVKNRGLNAVIVNPATIYGPGDAKKGSRKTQIKVAQGKFPFYTSGGVNVVPVANCVDGITAAFSKGRTGERYILAGENLTIEHLFKVIAEAAGVAPPVKKMPSVLLHLLGFVGDTVSPLGLPFPVSRENAWTATLFHWFSSKKAQEELGFKPGSAQEAIRTSVKWMKENGYLK